MYEYDIGQKKVKDFNTLFRSIMLPRNELKSTSAIQKNKQGAINSYGI